jgi:molybdopterin-guanine dinucleotide biosynthesis protein
MTELVTPYTMVVSGQTGSGKTHFVAELIKHQEEMHDVKFDKIILAFSMIQPIYLNLKLKHDNITLVEGFPTEALEEIMEKSENENTLIVLDDLMVELENDKRIAALFTKMRHKNVSTIFLVQNLYFNSKYMRTVTRNSHYMAIFENPRDAGMINTLGRQVFPTNGKFLPDAFRQATIKPYGYLFLDLKPGSDKRLRVREGVLPGEQTFVYLPS